MQILKWDRLRAPACSAPVWPGAIFKLLWTSESLSEKMGRTMHTLPSVQDCHKGPGLCVTKVMASITVDGREGARKEEEEDIFQWSPPVSFSWLANQPKDGTRQSWRAGRYSKCKIELLGALFSTLVLQFPGFWLVLLIALLAVLLPRAVPVLACRFCWWDGLVFVAAGHCGGKGKCCSVRDVGPFPDGALVRIKVTSQPFHLIVSYLELMQAVLELT